MTEQLLFASAAGFESARQLKALPDGHRMRGVHGHSFLATVRAGVPPAWAGFPGGEAGELERRLADCARQLDCRLLNDLIGEPSDEHLARWIRSRLDVPGVEQVGVRGAPREGVELDRGGRAHAWRRYAFEAAHRLPRVPPGHKCANLHGHGFEAVLHAAQAGADSARLDACWAPLHERLHHACLNDIEGLENPTSEIVAGWIWRRLEPALPGLSWVTVHENATCGASFDGGRYRIWKDFSLDSSLRLKRAPAGDRRGGVHGHTYTLRLHLAAPLDAVMGWTMDFGDVKELFAPIFLRLDHRPLHEIAELEDCDTATVARWIRDGARPLLPALDRIDLYETAGRGAILTWNAEGAALPV